MNTDKSEESKAETEEPSLKDSTVESDSAHSQKKITKPSI